MNIQGENKTQNRIFALLPLWVVIGIFMIGPLLVMAVVSLMESNVYGGVHFKFSLSGYRQILFDTNLVQRSKYNNISDKFELRKSEEILVQNLTENFIQEIISSISSLNNDN